MFERIKSELQWLDGECQNSNVWTDKGTNPMSAEIRSAFQYLDR